MDVSTSSKIATSSLFIYVRFYFEDAGEGKCRQKRKSDVCVVCVGLCMCSSNFIHIHTQVSAEPPAERLGGCTLSADLSQ